MKIVVKRKRKWKQLPMRKYVQSAYIDHWKLATLCDTSSWFSGCHNGADIAIKDERPSMPTEGQLQSIVSEEKSCRMKLAKYKKDNRVKADRVAKI